jgi:predicted O-methyltransferase YrrM
VDTERLLQAIEVMADQVVRDVGAYQYLCHALAPPVFIPPGRGWPANDETTAYVVDRLQRMGPGWTVLELGSGTSTAWLGLAARKYGGRVWSLEHDEHHLERTRDLLGRVAAGDVVEVVHAPLVELEPYGHDWYSIDRLPAEARFDLLFVDGPPGAVAPHARRPAFPLLRDRLADGAVVVLDDTVRAAEHEVAQRWIEEDAAPGELQAVDRLGRSTAFVFRRQEQR